MACCAYVILDVVTYMAGLSIDDGVVESAMIAEECSPLIIPRPILRWNFPRGDLRGEVGETKRAEITDHR